MIIIKPRFLKRRLGRQLLAAILGPPLDMRLVSIEATLVVVYEEKGPFSFPDSNSSPCRVT
jgi:hypothetical protein